MMSYVKKISARRSECFSDTMDDDSDDKDSKRKSRNLSEKKRRDQFNLLVSELGSMVSSGGRKMDKSTVLKSTISFLKNHNETTMRSRVNEIQEDWKPTFLTNEEFTHLILEAVDGFIMVFSTSGQIFYVSENVTSLLGHLPDDIINMTLFELTSEEDHNNLYNILLRHNEDDGPTSFSCHVKRGAGPEPKLMVDYELVHFMGYFRLEEDLSHNENKYSYPQEEDGPRLVFYGTGKIHTPQLLREMALVDSTKSEFISRHSLEWKFLFLDHRAPPIIGYLPFELLGTSGYDYYHVDDLDKVIKCHDSLMKKGEGTSCYYRFLTKGQQWIWLQTRFYITYHQWNSKPEFVVCTHRVVSYLNVIKRNRKEEDVPELMNEPWTSTKTPKSVIRQRPSSDCTSMSADSPGSIQSLMTQYSVKSKATLSQKTAHSSSSNQAVTKQETSQQPQTLLVQPTMENFLEPNQYVAAIPISPVLTGFSPQAAVLSPIPRVDNLSQPQDQFHVDLQRKHAELQAMIGRQQAELRRVSEQLLMAKLGLLTTESEAVPHVSYTISAGTVSSTTSLPGFPGVPTVSSPQAMVPLAVPISLPMAMPQHHNLDVVFSPDSNTQNK